MGHGQSAVAADPAVAKACVRNPTTGYRVINPVWALGPPHRAMHHTADPKDAAAGKVVEPTAADVQAVQQLMATTGAPNCLGGMTLCVTGEFPGVTRDQVVELLRRYGARVVGAVAAGVCDQLLCGFGDVGRVKLRAAADNNVPVLSVVALQRLIAMSPARPKAATARRIKRAPPAAAPAPAAAVDAEAAAAEEEAKRLPQPAATTVLVVSKRYAAQWLQRGEYPTADTRGQVFVKTLSGVTKGLPMDYGQSVWELVFMAGEAFAVPSAADPTAYAFATADGFPTAVPQALIFAGRQLELDRGLVDVGVSYLSTVHAIDRWRSEPKRVVYWEDQLDAAGAAKGDAIDNTRAQVLWRSLAEEATALATQLFGAASCAAAAGAGAGAGAASGAAVALPGSHYSGVTCSRGHRMTRYTNAPPPDSVLAPEFGSATGTYAPQSVSYERKSVPRGQRLEVFRSGAVTQKVEWECWKVLYTCADCGKPQIRYAPEWWHCDACASAEHTPDTTHRRAYDLCALCVAWARVRVLRVAANVRAGLRDAGASALADVHDLVLLTCQYVSDDEAPADEDCDAL